MDKKSCLVVEARRNGKELKRDFLPFIKEFTVKHGEGSDPLEEMLSMSEYAELKDNEYIQDLACYIIDTLPDNFKGEFDWVSVTWVRFADEVATCRLSFNVRNGCSTELIFENLIKPDSVHKYFISSVLYKFTV